jgi:hypothetical protein
MTAEPTPEFLDQLRADTIDRIERYGYTATVVGTGECSVPGCTCSPEPYPYAYSLGLCEHGHPELVVFGLPLTHVNTVMKPVFEAVRDGSPLAIGREHRHDLGGGPVVSLLPVPDLWVQRDPGRIGGWFDVYRSAPPPFVQICWADRHGAMPWQPDCDREVSALQPILADDPLRYPRPPRNTARHRRRR